MPLAYWIVLIWALGIPFVVWIMARASRSGTTWVNDGGTCLIIGFFWPICLTMGLMDQVLGLLVFLVCRPMSFIAEKINDYIHRGDSPDES